MPRPWRFALPTIALLCAMAGAALADPPSQEPPSNIPQVTIQAEREAITEQARQFVGKVTGSSWADADDHPLELWRMPVCPAVAGLPAPQGEFVFKELAHVMTEAGAPVGKDGCVPNLIVVATTQPVEFLTAWRKRDKRLFDNTSPSLVKRFLEQPLPVRVWYNTGLAGEDAAVGSLGGGLSGAYLSGGMSGGGMGESGGVAASAQAQTMLGDIPTFRQRYGGTRLSLTAAPDLSSEIVIVDIKQCEGFGWGALADYIAMIALTNIDLSTNFDDVPSILALFKAPADKRQVGLTDWDRAYLKALYHTERMMRSQREKIRQRMVDEIDRVKTAATTP